MLPHVTESTLPTDRPRSYAANSARQYVVAAYARILTRLLGIVAGFVYVVQVSPVKPRHWAEPDRVLTQCLSEAEIQATVQAHVQRFPYEAGAPAHEQYIDVLVGLVTSPPIALALVLATIVTLLLAR